MQTPPLTMSRLQKVGLGAFTERYPRGVFDLVMGINRWQYRVIAYVALMTDQYPPFRLDQGPDEPVGPAPLPPPSTMPVADTRDDVVAHS
jgi:hypothetical protein